jgi:hypothetical protein
MDTALQHAIQWRTKPPDGELPTQSFRPGFPLLRRMDTLAAFFSCLLFFSFSFTRNETFSWSKILFLLSQALSFLSFRVEGAALEVSLNLTSCLPQPGFLISNQPENTSSRFLHQIYPIYYYVTLSRIGTKVITKLQ